MLADLHNHTPLCMHAKDKPAEYVKRAVELGTKYFGFSDHAPMKFDEEYRMKFSQIELYKKMVQEAKDEFGSEINILFAYEVDFLNGFMDKRVLEADVDYLIGSIHFINGWGFDNPKFIGQYQNKNIDDIWREYFNAVEALANSGLFQIVGHLDLLKIFKFLPKTDIKILAQKAMKAIKKSGLVIEINTAGFRKPINEQYPSSALLEIASELEIPITFGSDAHAMEHVGFKSKEVETLAKKFSYAKCAVFQKKDRIMIEF